MPSFFSYHRFSLAVCARGLCLVAIASCFAAGAAKSQTTATLSSSETRASKALDAAKRQGSPELYAFLKPMPKGADLHMHLSGAVYAETFIGDAVKLGLCIAAVNPGTPPTPVPQGALRFTSPSSGKDGTCPVNTLPAADAMQNQALYDELIDSFSMRGYVPSPGISGHDQFFATFARFSGLSGMLGEWLDELATRAAAQNEQYLEIMHTPPSSHAAAAAVKAGWPVVTDDNYKLQLSKLRDALLRGGLREDIPIDEQEFSDARAAQRKLENCGAENTSGDKDQGVCALSIHFLYQVLRGYPPAHVFAQTLLAFEVASADPDVVGLNFVMPEDGRISMQDYHLQMLMLDYLHGIYPEVRVSLHAGELAPGMVTPAGLRFHIREALELGHAERIGHGVDVLFEDRPAELLKEMAEKHVMVEINLTSNDVILGVKGTDSPFSAYREAHVPTALSTDDEGVSRIDLTHEYVKAVVEQNLSYADLKKSARTSLEHAFLHGESLWSAPDDFAHRKTNCSASIGASSRPTESCAAFLLANERARLEWELERRFAVFEAGVH